jgi:hypothetical protein
MNAKEAEEKRQATERYIEKLKAEALAQKLQPELTTPAQ